jgi:hypothetical protein
MWHAHSMVHKSIIQITCQQEGDLDNCRIKSYWNWEWKNTTGWRQEELGFDKFSIEQLIKMNMISLEGKDLTRIQDNWILS